MWWDYFSLLMHVSKETVITWTINTILDHLQQRAVWLQSLVILQKGRVDRTGK